MNKLGLLALSRARPKPAPALRPKGRCARFLSKGLTLSVTGEFTVSKFAILAASAAIFALSPIASAEPSGGTAEEAKAMLMRAVAAVKGDKASADPESETRTIGGQVY